MDVEEEGREVEDAPGGRGEEEEGGWCSRRNLMLEAVRKHEMYEVKKRSISLRYL